MFKSDGHDNMSPFCLVGFYHLGFRLLPYLQGPTSEFDLIQGRKENFSSKMFQIPYGVVGVSMRYIVAGGVVPENFPIGRIVKILQLNIIGFEILICHLLRNVRKRC